MVRMKSAMGVFTLLCCALILMGCENKEKEKALTARAAAAEMLLSKVKTDLAKAEGQVASLKEELGAAKSARDELEQQVKQLTGERDKAITVQTAAGQETVKKLTDQLNEQTGKVTELQNQISGLQKTIQEQQATIEQLQKTIDSLRRAPAAGAAEPNAAAPGQQ